MPLSCQFWGVSREIRSRQRAPATSKDPGWCFKRQERGKTVVTLMRKPVFSSC